MPDKGFWVFWGVFAAIGLILAIRSVVELKKRGPLFPPVGECQILFRETCASGRALENIFAGFGGARNCLVLTVTPDELWTQMWFPFSILSSLLELEHRIKKQDIISVSEERGIFRRKLIVKFRGDDGKPEQLELVPWRYEEFKRALEVGISVS